MPISVTLYPETVSFIDSLVESKEFRSRSDLIDTAVEMFKAKHLEEVKADVK